MSDFLKLGKNTSGRDFIVGDIHFKMPDFFYGLNELDFNPARDRILSVGDLVDRGPDPTSGLKLLDQPWFHMVMGNHEQMLIQAYDNDPYGSSPARGAAWWDLIDKRSRYQIVQRLKSLPIAIELAVEQGLIGIVHADVPIGMGWSDFKNDIVNDETKHYALWGQERVRDAIVSGVHDVWRVCAGHTKVQAPLRLGNYLALDCTGGNEGALAFYAVKEDRIYSFDRRFEGEQWDGALSSISSCNTFRS